MISKEIDLPKGLRRGMSNNAGRQRPQNRHKGFTLDLSAIKATGRITQLSSKFLEDVPENHEHLKNPDSPAEKFRSKYRLNGILFLATNLKSLNGRFIPLFGSVGRSQNQHERFMDVMKWIFVNFEKHLQNYVDSCGYVENTEITSISKVMQTIDDSTSVSVITSFYQWFHTFSQLVGILRLQDKAIKDFIEQYDRLDEDNSLLKEVLSQLCQTKGGKPASINIKKVYNVCRKRAIESRDRSTMFPEVSQGVHLSPKIQTYDKETMVPENPLVTSNNWCQTELDEYASETTIGISMYSIDCQTADVLTMDAMTGDTKPIPNFIETEAQTDPIELYHKPSSPSLNEESYGTSSQEMKSFSQEIDKISTEEEGEIEEVVGEEEEEIKDHLASRLGSLASIRISKSTLARISTASVLSSHKSLNNEIEMLCLELDEKERLISELEETINKLGQSNEENKKVWLDQVEGLEYQLSNMKTENCTLEETCTELNKTIAKLTKNVESLEGDIVNLDQMNAEREQMLVERNTTIQDRDAEIKQLKLQCDRLQAHERQLEGDIENYNALIVELHKKQASLKEDQKEISSKFEEEKSALEHDMSQMKEKHEADMTQMKQGYDDKIGLLMKFPDAITQAAEYAKMNPIILLSDEDLQDLIKANTLRISLLEAKNKQYRSEKIRRADLASRMEEIDTERMAALISQNNAKEMADPGQHMLARMKHRIQSLARLQLAQQCPHAHAADDDDDDDARDAADNDTTARAGTAEGAGSFEWLAPDEKAEAMAMAANLRANPVRPTTVSPWAGRWQSVVGIEATGIRGSRVRPSTRSQGTRHVSRAAAPRPTLAAQASKGHAVGLVNKNPAQKPITYRHGTARRYRHKTAGPGARWK